MEVQEVKVLNYGSLNLDYVYSVDHILVGGETISSTNMETFCGGKGLNQSIALAKAGVEVYHAGMIGEGGEMLLKACEESGVKSEYIRQVSGKCGHTIIQVDKNGQNCILLYGGSNQKQTKEYIDEVLGHFEKDDMIILQNEVNLVEYIIDKAYDRGMKIVLNPSPFDERLNACDLSKISLFLMNEIEGEQITGKSKPDEILETILAMFPKAQVVLTLGGEGAVYQDTEIKCKQGIFKTEVVDTTAAGDTFSGYFISAIISGKKIEEALLIAAKASSIAVSRPGATSSIPMWDEVIGNI